MSSGATRRGTIRPRADRRGVWGPGGHAGLAFVLVGAGALAADAAGAPAGEVWTGGGLAWAIQAASLRPLVRALEEGRSATRPWVGGMAARLAGLGVVALLGGSTALDAPAAALAYVAAVVPLLWMEGLWLNRAAHRAAEGAGAAPAGAGEAPPAGDDAPDGRVGGAPAGSSAPGSSGRRTTDQRTDGT